MIKKINVFKEYFKTNITLPIGSFFNHQIRFLDRLVYWIPKLYHDEDWDEAYLLKMMEYKIARLRKNIEKNKRHTNWRKTVKSMLVAEALIKRLTWPSNYNYQQRSEFCTCPQDSAFDKKYFVETTNGNAKWVYPLCDFCCKFDIKARQIKEQNDYNYLWLHINKHLKDWWT